MAPSFLDRLCSMCSTWIQYFYRLKCGSHLSMTSLDKSPMELGVLSGALHASYMCKIELKGLTMSIESTQNLPSGLDAIIQL